MRRPWSARAASELVAEDFFEESVFGFVEEVGEADEAALGIAAAEASGQSGRPLPGGSGGEVEGVPEAEPAVGRSDGFGRERGVHGLGAKANTKLNEGEGPRVRGRCRICQGRTLLLWTRTRIVSVRYLECA